MNTEDGHMLVFGIDRYVYGMHRMRDLSTLVEQAGGVIVAAHPYRRLMPFYPADDELWSLALERALVSPAFRHVCALEAINGHGSQHENLFSWQLCARLGLPGVAGSDAHHVTRGGHLRHPLPAAHRSRGRPGARAEGGALQRREPARQGGARHPLTPTVRAQKDKLNAATASWHTRHLQ